MATNLSVEVDAFGVRKSNTMGEEQQHSEMSASESVAAPVVMNRGKVKFTMPKSLMIAAAAQTNNPVPRTRLNRVRTTEAPVNSISRDSAEKDFSLEDQKVKTTTSKVIWWTTSTPSPIITSDSKEQDDAVSSEKMTLPIKSDRVLPVNRFNRFRTTPAPTPVVTRDSIEQVEDDGFVPAVGRAANKPAMPKSRFNRVRTTAAPQLISRDSLELNDVSLEVVRVNPTASPALNRGRTASRGRKIMNRLNRTQTPVETTTTTTTRNFILVDSKEVDLSFEDVAILPTTTQAPAGIETTTIGDEVTTSSIFIISKQSDERIDLSTELDDMLTTVAIQGTTTVESEELTGTTVILAKQSNEWDDLDDILLLQTTTATATTTPAPTTPEMAATTPEPTTTEAVTTTTTTTTTTAAPVVTRPQSRGRGKFQQATTSTANQVSRVNRIRTTSMAPKISGDSDEQKDSIIMAVLTTSAPVSKSRFSRVRASTVRPLTVTEDAQKEGPAAATTTTTTRSPLLGNRFSRFRASTTTTTAVPATTKSVEREDAAPRSFPQKKSRFGNNARPGVVRVSGDSGEKETILIGDVLKVNKANNVVLVAVDSSDAVSQVTKATPAAVRNPAAASRRNPMVRGRMTTTARPIVSRHSGEENVSLEDVVFKINPSAEQMKISPSVPAVAAPVAEVSLITRHSDEQVIVPVPGGSLVVDVSDEMPSATTLDPISIESAEKDDLTMVVDSAGSPVAVVVDLPDISDEIIHTAIVPTTSTVNPISRESEELPVVQTRTRKVVNRGRLNRKPISQI